MLPHNNFSKKKKEEPNIKIYTLGKISIWNTADFQVFPLTKNGKIVGTPQLWEMESKEKQDPENYIMRPVHFKDTLLR